MSIGVRYIGSDPALQGTTAISCKKGHKWWIQLDRYPGGPPAAQCNPTDHPLMFGRHWFPPKDWEAIEDSCEDPCGDSCG